VPGVWPLRVGQLQRQQPAMTGNHREAVEVARRGALGQRAAMAPGDLALATRGGGEADERALLVRGWAHAGAGLPPNGHATREARLGTALPEYDRRDRGVESAQAGERGFAGIELTGPGAQRPGWGGIIEICAGRWSAEAQRLSALPYREAGMRQAVDLADGAVGNQGRLPESYG
jgi:hypothetical protein